MVNFADVIAFMHPEKNYEISDEGNGPFISYWDETLGSKPTDEEIEIATPLAEVFALKSRLAALRYEKEVSGIMIGSQQVSTNRDEMPIWQGMLLDMTLRPGATSSFEYKPRGGNNTTLTAQQVQRVYECFAWYVQACFATERQLIAAIDAGAPLEQVEAMLDSVWPQTQFDWTAPT